MYQLPEDFIFGGATTTYQVGGVTKEGGKSPIAWDDFLIEQGRLNPNPVGGLYHQYSQDIELYEKSGVDELWLSIAWSRVFPDGIGEVSQEGADYYHKVFTGCQGRNIMALVTLRHFDTSKVLSDGGDFLNRDMIRAFINYAKFCSKEFTEVCHWSVFNEIYPVTTNQYLFGIFPPGIRYNLSRVIQRLHNMMCAHAHVTNLLKGDGYQGEVGMVHSLEIKYPVTNGREDECAASLDDVPSIRFPLDVTCLGYYSGETMEAPSEIYAANNASYDFLDSDFEEMKKAGHRNDYLGINHYQYHFVKACNGENTTHHNGMDDKGTSVYKTKDIDEHIYKGSIPRTDWDWIIYPEGLYDSPLHIKADYPRHNKIYITENGMGCKDEFDGGAIMDQPCIDYLKVCLQSLAKAIDTGVNIEGYLLWSLTDLLSWSDGYNKRYGLFYVDSETQRRYPKVSAYWYKYINDTKTVGQGV